MAVAAVTARTGRGAELGLLVIAVAIGVGAFANVGLSMTNQLPDRFWLYCAVLTGLAVAGHIVLRIRAPYADPVIFPVALALNGVGLAMIYRLDLGSKLTGGQQNLAERQLQWTVLGIVTAFVLVWFLKDNRMLRRYTYTAMVVGIVLVAMPLVPGVGTRKNGAQIWMDIGGYSLQPAEFAKIAFAVFFAGYLVTNRDTLALAGPKILGLQLPRLRDLGPLVIVWLVSLAILVFERDLGTSLLFFGLFVAMLYIATERGSWVVIGLLMFAAGAVAATKAFGHVQARVDVWLHPFSDELFNRATGGSGQLVRGLFGLANGGLFGTGWGQGYPRLVPYAFSDFIYASLGEELGLTGLLGILLAYLILTERGLRAAIGVRDGFGKLLAGGLAFVMAWQLFVVVGGITRIIPLTGLTMPFVAQGGSSLLANWIVAGLLLRISHDARRPSALPQRGQVAPAVRHPVAVGTTRGHSTGQLPVVAPDGAATEFIAAQVPGAPEEFDDDFENLAMTRPATDGSTGESTGDPGDAEPTEIVTPADPRSPSGDGGAP